jgi:hypothetical protein
LQASNRFSEQRVGGLVLLEIDLTGEEVRKQRGDDADPIRLILPVNTATQKCNEKQTKKEQMKKSKQTKESNLERQFE